MGFCPVGFCPDTVELNRFQMLKVVHTLIYFRTQCDQVCTLMSSVNLFKPVIFLVLRQRAVALSQHVLLVCVL